MEDEDVDVLVQGSMLHSYLEGHMSDLVENTDVVALENNKGVPCQQSSSSSLFCDDRQVNSSEREKKATRSSSQPASVSPILWCAVRVLLSLSSHDWLSFQLLEADWLAVMRTLIYHKPNWKRVQLFTAGHFIRIFKMINDWTRWNACMSQCTRFVAANQGYLDHKLRPELRDLMHGMHSSFVTVIQHIRLSSLTILDERRRLDCSDCLMTTSRMFVAEHVDDSINDIDQCSCADLKVGLPLCQIFLDSSFEAMHQLCRLLHSEFMSLCLQHLLLDADWLSPTEYPFATLEVDVDRLSAMLNVAQFVNPVDKRYRNPQFTVGLDQRSVLIDELQKSLLHAAKCSQQLSHCIDDRQLVVDVNELHAVLRSCTQTSELIIAMLSKPSDLNEPSVVSSKSTETALSDTGSTPEDPNMAREPEDLVFELDVDDRDEIKENQPTNEVEIQLDRDVCNRVLLELNVVIQDRAVEMRRRERVALAKAKNVPLCELPDEPPVQPPIPPVLQPRIRRIIMAEASDRDDEPGVSDLDFVNQLKLNLATSSMVQQREEQVLGDSSDSDTD